MSEHYSIEDYHAGYPKGIEQHFWHRTRHDALARFLQKHVPANSRILDIGCGMGITTTFLRSRGYDCRGVELGPAPISGSVATYVQTEQDVFALPDADKASVDTVLLLDVIEHLAEPVEFLMRVAEHFPKCSRMLVTVPARQELWSSYDEAWGHQLRYSRSRLSNDINATEFKVTHCAYHFQSLYLAALLSALLRLPRQSDFKNPARNLLSSAMHSLIAALGMLENRLVPGKIFGSTLVCIAERALDS